MLPKTGHGINLEEPAAFNAAVEDFIRHVETGRWAASPIVTGKNVSLLAPER
jgi:hypothetical protein